MSRLAKKIITIPSGVKVEFNRGNLIVQGPKGKLSQDCPLEINIEIKDDQIKIVGDFSNRIFRAEAGLTFALISNMIKGVTEGYAKQLEIIGVGYRAQVQGENINLQLGFSHPVIVPIPEGIEIKIPKPTQILIQGTDKSKLGNFAAQIRAIYPPEPYKGKGIRYQGEYVRKKIGKAVTK